MKDKLIEALRAMHEAYTTEHYRRSELGLGDAEVEHEKAKADNLAKEILLEVDAREIFGDFSEEYEMNTTTKYLLATCQRALDSLYARDVNATREILISGIAAIRSKNNDGYDASQECSMSALCEKHGGICWRVGCKFERSKEQGEGQ